MKLPIARLCCCLLLLLASAGASFAESSDRDPIQRWLQPQTWTRDVSGPILQLGKSGSFDDRHMLTPLVALENGRYRMWYSGSRGEVRDRIFRLGAASSSTGRKFRKRSEKPIFEFGDSRRSILTPTLLRSPEGTVLREGGKLRMWFSAADLAGDHKHTLHESTSTDGVHWSRPSPAQMDNLYAPTVIKEGDRYRMWYIDISGKTWVVRHAQSPDGKSWTPSAEVCLRVDQPWESKNLFYPTVVKADGVYLIWYGSYWNGHTAKTALGMAASTDGIHWTKNPHNPVFRPDESRAWESHYTTSQSVMRMEDGSWRIWYSSRKAPPHVNKYFAMGTARWAGPDYEVDDAPLSKQMPDPAADRKAFEDWQTSKRQSLAQMLGLPTERGPLDAERRGEVEHDGLVIEKWVFTSEPGSRIPALLYRKKQSDAPMPAVVLTYGHGGSKSAADYQYIAQLYAKSGVAVLAMDPLGEEERNARGKLGSRAHDPLPVHRRAWKAGRPILGKMIWDAMRGVDFLSACDDIDAQRIGVAGNSLGGALAVWMAALEPRLRCAIVSGWSIDDAAMHYGKHCTRVPNQRMRQACTWPQFLSLAAPHCRVLIMNGDADIVIDQAGDSSAWRGTRANAKDASQTFATLGAKQGVRAWFEPAGGHRPYPAHKVGLSWLVEQLHPQGVTADLVAAMPEVNFGRWAKSTGQPLDDYYAKPLHLLGATVVDAQIQPFKPNELACLKEEERGSAAFTLEGWLQRVASEKN